MESDCLFCRGFEDGGGWDDVWVFGVVVGGGDIGDIGVELGNMEM